MKITPKIEIQRAKTDQFNVVVQDKTGAFSSGNPGGYGSPNAIGADEISRYIFVLKNLITDDVYTQVNGSDIETEVMSPSLSTIPYGADVIISPRRGEEVTFYDGIYSLTTYVVDGSLFEGAVEAGSSIITDCPYAMSIEQNYDAVIIGGVPYKILTASSSTLMLDTEVTEGVNEFSCAVVSTLKFIQSNQFTDTLNSALMMLANKCGKEREDLINDLSEAQMYLWGAKENMEAENYTKAEHFYKLAIHVLNKCNH